MEIDNIYCLDCIQGMKQLPNDYVDLTVTSPPYDNLREYKGYIFNFMEVAKELYRITKSGGIVVWVVGDSVVDGSETGTSFDQALYFMDMGFKLHDTMIYEKCGFQYPSSKSSKRYHQVFEYMFVFSKGKPKTYNPICDRVIKWPNGAWGKNTHRQKDGTLQETKRGLDSKEKGKRFNIWTYPAGRGFGTKDEIAYKHPARFPEQLAVDHILSWSNPEELIFDPMVGSGTTCKMAKKLGRHYLGFDISEEYILISKERLKEI